MNSITTWIHAKLEYICGVVSSVITGSATILSEPSPETNDTLASYIIKAILVILFGFLGAFGAGLYKWVEGKIKNNKNDK